METTLRIPSDCMYLLTEIYMETNFQMNPFAFWLISLDRHSSRNLKVAVL